MSDDKPDIFEPEENWIKEYWRPAMGWQYFAVCVFDFLLAPIFTAWYAWFAKIPYEVWKPITMGEGGFYHMAMAAIIGVVAWTRGQEKITRINEAEKIDDVLERRRRRMNIERVDPDSKDPSIPPSNPDN